MTQNTAMENYDYSIYYKRYHTEEPEHLAKMVRFHKWQLQPFLPRPSTQRVLDVGCGMGFALMAMKEMGFEDVSGIDLDESQIRACARLGVTATHVSNSSEYLRTCGRSFDVVLLLDVLEHIPPGSQVGLLRTIHGVLSPDGTLIIQVPNANSILASRYRYNDFTHASSFTEHSLSFVLENARFADVRILADGRVGGRPSLRFWRQDVRSSWRPWFIRWMWAQVFESELGAFEDTSKIPLDLNLRASARRG